MISANSVDESISKPSHDHAPMNDPEYEMAPDADAKLDQMLCQNVNIASAINASKMGSPQDLSMTDEQGAHLPPMPDADRLPSPKKRV